MIIPCDLSLKECLPCLDNPIANISAEAPDVNVFIGFRDFKWNPPLGVTYFQLACKSLCFSTVSQHEADLCAQQRAQDCVWKGGKDPVVPPVPPGPGNTGGKGGGSNNPGGIPPANPRNPIKRFSNKLQTCDALCPDGSPFTEQVVAGTITALSQTLANAQARSLACNLAQQNLFCISDVDPPGSCIGESYFFRLNTSGGFDLIWSIDGSLPPGLNLDPVNGTISGTPLSPGSFTFTVEVTDSLGRGQTKAFTICIMEIVTAALLPDAPLGDAYAEPLIQIPATVSSEVWTLVSGSLPDGITLAANGVLTGTPTVAGMFEFTIKVDATCDGSAVSCQKTFSLEAVSTCGCGSGGGCGINWDALSWNGFTLFAQPATPSTATGSAVGHSVEFDVEAVDGAFDVGFVSVRVDSPPTSPFIVTDTVNCSWKLKVNLTSFFDDGGNTSVTFGLDILQDGLVVFQLRKSSANLQGAFPDFGVLNVGCNEYDVPITAAVGSLIEIRGNAVDDPGAYAVANGEAVGAGGSAGVALSFKLCNS